jgi:hypothetical protein
MIKSLSGFTKLPKKSKCNVLLMLFYIMRAELILRFFPYKSTNNHIFINIPRKIVLSENTQMQLKQTIKLFETICRHLPWNPSCLPRSIAFRDFLAKQNILAEIKIGVNKSDGFIAHAWIECCGYEIFKNGSYAELIQVKRNGIKEWTT